MSQYAVAAHNRGSRDAVVPVPSSIAGLPPPNSAAGKKVLRLRFATQDEEHEWLNVAWKRWQLFSIWRQELAQKFVGVYQAAAAEAAFRSPVREDMDAAVAEAKAIEAARRAANMVQWVERRERAYKEVEARYFEIAPTAVNFEQANAIALMERVEARRARDAHAALIRNM